MINEVDAIVSQVMKAYEWFIDNIRAKYLSSVSGKRAAMPSERLKYESSALKVKKEARKVFERDLKKLTDDFVNSVITHHFSVDEISAVMTNELKVELMDYLNHSADYISHFFAAEAIKDVKRGSDRLKMLSFDVSTNIATSDYENALKGAMVKTLVDGDPFSRNGKPLLSANRVRLIIRHHLISVANEVVMLIASKLGEDKFVIKNKPGHRLNGQELSLSGKVGMRYLDAKESIFHPNSNSLIHRTNK